MRALVIDDSKAIRSILGRMLTGVGFEIVEAAHGGEALEAVEEHDDFDLILVDWNMPVMDGLEFIKAFKGRRPGAPTWLMMVTTETEHAQVVRALAAGANEYVMKPFTAEVLLGKLEMMGLVTA